MLVPANSVSHVEKASGSDYVRAWLDALNKANTLIFVIMKATIGTYPYAFSYVVPKDAVSSSNLSFLTGAYHTSNQYYASVSVSSSNITYGLYHNSSAADVSNVEFEYFYI